MQIEIKFSEGIRPKGAVDLVFKLHPFEHMMFVIDSSNVDTMPRGIGPTHIHLKGLQCTEVWYKCVLNTVLPLAMGGTVVTVDDHQRWVEFVDSHVSSSEQRTILYSVAKALET